MRHKYPGWVKQGNQLTSERRSKHQFMKVHKGSVFSLCVMRLRGQREEEEGEFGGRIMLRYVSLGEQTRRSSVLLEGVWLFEILKSPQRK